MPEKIEEEGHKKTSVINYSEASIKSSKEGDGYKWNVRIIKTGLDKNNKNWSEILLKENLEKFEGCRVFVLSEAQHSAQNHPYGKPPLELIGWIKSVSYIGDGVYGKLVIVKNTRGTELRDTLVSAFDSGKEDFLGLSVDIYGSEDEQEGFTDITSIDRVTVDVVYDPAAGGNFIRMAAAIQNKEITMTEEEKRALEAQKKLLDDQKRDLDVQIKAAQTATDSAVAQGEVMKKAKEDLQKILCATRLQTLLKESELPIPVCEKITASWKDKVFEDVEVITVIKAEKDCLDKIVASTISGAGGIRLTKDDHENRIKMFDDFFDGKVQSFKSTYINYTGDETLSGLKKNCKRLLASMDSTSLNLVLQDSMNKKMVKEYGASAYNKDWRKIASVVPRFDFRTNHITRMGGYGDLPTVAEGAAYTAATSPTDEEATYAMVKRGYTEDITWEMLRNDDVRAIRRIPIKVAVACARQLYEFVFAFLADNPTIYTGAALFTAGKGNLGTAALDVTVLNTRRRALIGRTELSSGKKLGIPAKYLIVPTALDKTAYDLIAAPRNSDFNPTSAEFTRTLELELIVVHPWTDANNFYLACSPSDVEGLEIGFLDGNENPEFFVQDQETAGSMFTHDKITYKWRHLYNGAIIDDRQFDGNIVS